LGMVEMAISADHESTRTAREVPRPSRRWPT
jgi:hypothetical protein